MTTVTPYGWSPQTSTLAQPLNAAPTMGQAQLRQQPKQPKMPNWYEDMLKMGAQSYSNSGGGDPAGLQSGADWFKNYYGGYNGSTPVQSGLLDMAAQGMAGNKIFGQMGVTPQQAGTLAQNYMNQYAQNGIAGNAGNINGGIRNYLSGYGFQRQGGQPRGLLG